MNKWFVRSIMLLDIVPFRISGTWPLAQLYDDLVVLIIRRARNEQKEMRTKYQHPPLTHPTP